MLYDKNVSTFILQLCYDKNGRQTLTNHRPEACNFIKKNILAQVFSCEFIRTPFIKEHFWWLFLVLL